jgi:hypothetical protein
MTDADMTVKVVGGHGGGAAPLPPIQKGCAG